MIPRADSVEVRFVLGQLSEEEKTALETRFFSDDDFFNELLEVEADLVDAYVQDEMTPSERERFEAALDLFPARREKVEFARALQRVLTRPGARDIPLWRGTLTLPLAAAVLLFGAGTAWFALESTRLGSQRAALEAERTQLTETVKRLESQSQELRARVAELGSQTRMPEVAGQIASFLLVPGSTRGGPASNDFRIPETAEAIAIEASLETSAYETYRAAIQRPSGETVFSQRGLRPKRTKTGPIVDVVLSPVALSPGDYILVLSGEKSGGPETVSEYAFRIARP